ncbi:rubrerythrin [Seleniivibrio woodruffii]|uniref:Rubrerythrin n=1 Tax=Seleniivibrio woodruffii TaxID=1078050 RepID=A0A4R1KBT6_9BACT|nr:rubrerythrin [Seleniivibrio woodruffii]TCK61577.1 rubrerythrin [Seleniivibrio woodruffii]TVZ35308.1 rubrerythrin [Seleniivibrio woodruffii]
MEATVIEALNEAARKEQLTLDFYVKLLDLVAELSSKEIIKELIETKKRFKTTIEKAIACDCLEDLGRDSSCKLRDLGIGKTGRSEVITNSLNVQELLLIAIRHEDASMKYYESMADKFKGTEAGEAFTRLAYDVACHKKDIQYIYDDIVNIEN